MRTLSLSDRILDLFRPLAAVKPVGAERDHEGEPVVMVEGHATLHRPQHRRRRPDRADPGDVEDRRLEDRAESGFYYMVGLAEDPVVAAAAEQAKNN